MPVNNETHYHGTTKLEMTCFDVIIIAENKNLLYEHKLRQSNMPVPSS